MNESEMRAQFEAGQKDAVTPGSDEEEEDSAQLREELFAELDEAQLPIDAWEKAFDRELSVFKKGEKYSYVKDMKNAFAHGQATSLESKILSTIPDHAFWDIKKPVGTEEQMFVNPYNPARKYPYESFFDRRNYENWMHQRSTNMKLTEDISRHRRY